MGDPESVYHHHRQLIELRQAMPVLIHGAFRDIDPEHPKVFAYTRSLDEQRCLVLINFSREVVDYLLPEGMTIVATLLDNGASSAPVEAGASAVRLQPWQATLYAL